jgi:hypothetical protein
LGFADPRTRCLSQNERIEHSKEVSSGLDDMPAYGPGRPLPVSDKATQWPHEWTVIKPMLPNKARGELAASDLGFIQLASIKLWLRGNESTPWLAGC